MVQTRFSEKIEREKQEEVAEKNSEKPVKRGRKPNDGLPTAENSKRIIKTLSMDKWVVDEITKLAQEDNRAFNNYVNNLLLKEIKKAQEDGRL